MNTLDHTREHVFIRSLPAVTDAKLTETLTGSADRLEEAVTAFNAESARIPRTFMPGEPQRAARQKLVRDFAARLLPVQQTTERLAKDVETTEKHLLGPSLRLRAPDGLTAEQTQAAELEVRAHYRKVADAERAELVKQNPSQAPWMGTTFSKAVELAYLEGCRRGDRQLCRALETAPAALPLLSPETIREGSEIYAESQFAEGYANLQEQRSVLSVLRADLARATRTIGVVEDPLASMMAKAAGTAA